MQSSLHCAIDVDFSTEIFFRIGCRSSAAFFYGFHMGNVHVDQGHQVRAVPDFTAMVLLALNVIRLFRRLFPALKIRLRDLNPSTKYCLVVDLKSIDNCRYRYEHSTWFTVTAASSSSVPGPASVAATAGSRKDASSAAAAAAGDSDEDDRGRFHVHPDSPATGSQWMMLNSAAPAAGSSSSSRYRQQQQQRRNHPRQLQDPSSSSSLTPNNNILVSFHRMKLTNNIATCRSTKSNTHVSIGF